MQSEVNFLLCLVLISFICTNIAVYINIGLIFTFSSEVQKKYPQKKSVKRGSQVYIKLEI